MGVYLPTPKEEKNSDWGDFNSGKLNGVRYAHSSMQGNLLKENKKEGKFIKRERKKVYPKKKKYFYLFFPEHIRSVNIL
jgi:Zn/Cd-binding protein ZinT